MPKRSTTWLNSCDAVVHLQRHDPDLGVMAERIVEAAIRSSDVRKRARSLFEAGLRDVTWDLPNNAEVAVYAGTIRYRGETVYDNIEIGRRDLDEFAVEFDASDWTNQLSLTGASTTIRKCSPLHPPASTPKVDALTKVESD